MTVESVVLRAAVGEQNYQHIEKVAALLDSLEEGGVISPEGLGLVIATLADEIVAQSVAREVCNDLLAGGTLGDTAETGGSRP